MYAEYVIHAVTYLAVLLDDFNAVLECAAICSPFRHIWLQPSALASCLGLLLGTEAPVMMPSGIDFSFLFFSFFYLSQLISCS